MAELSIANAMWGKTGYQFRPRFLDTLAENYGAGLRQWDFENAPIESAAAINEWANQNTKGKIPNVISPADLDETTRLILTNAIYFKGRWQKKFNEDYTKDEDFHLLDGSRVKVPLMFQRGSFNYGEGEGYQAVELAYQGGEQVLSMVVLLPREGQVESFESALHVDKLAGIIDGMRYREVVLKVPRFKLEREFSAKDVLAAMGMPDAFDQREANFSGMADFANIEEEEGLYISEVMHKALVEVNEEGTEAAAATVIFGGVMTESVRPPPVEMTIDRPFIFLIRDNATGSILFAGRVMNPVG